MRWFALLAVGLTLAACDIPQDQEVAIGSETAARVEAELPMVRDPAVNAYVTQLGQSLAATTPRADLTWHFQVVDSPEINAFALPGGYIYVNRGLIERTDRMDELAGVLGHEIGHVVRRHGVEQLKKASRANAAVAVVCNVTSLCQSTVSQVAINIAGSALMARYSRADEAEADSQAVVTLLAARIDPAGVPQLFETLIAERKRSPTAVDAFFASHPMEESRVERTRQEITALGADQMAGLLQDEPSFQQVRRRLKALPPSPPPRPLEDQAPPR